jgi:glycosyltransferase involved in cell wall biosynthesis
MGRREHLEVTLSFALQTFDKVIVVDWSCPQGSGEYASSEGASVIYKYGETRYNGAKAKNYGATMVTTDYIAFIDADTLCMPGLREEIELLRGVEKMVLSARNFDGTDVNDTTGFLVCATKAFWNVGGFGEWSGWGSEDLHLRGKLFLDEKLEVVRLSPMCLGAMAHGNDLRSVNAERPIEVSAIDNFNRLKAWFAEKGIPDYPDNPRIKDIVFIGPRPA